MINSNKFARWTAFVLTSGLVSCAPHKDNTKDVYQPPVPVIIKGSHRINLPTWDRSQHIDLDLQDGLDLRAANAARVDISAKCERGGANSQRTEGRLKSAQLVRLYQLLPVEWLAVDLAQAPMTCSFVVKLYNSAGSEKVYNIDFARIKDERPGTVSLELHGTVAPQMRQQFKVGALEGIRFRTDKATTGQAQILCGDGQSPDLNFDGVIPLGNFDFNRMTRHPERDAHVLQQRPLQLCRGIVVQNGMVQELTSLFDLQFPRVALKISPVALPYRGDQLYPADFGGAANGVQTPLGVYRIENPGSTSRALRFSKNSLPVHIHALHMYGGFTTIVRPWIMPVSKGGEHVQVAVEGSNIKVILGPKAHYLFSVDFAAPAKLDCQAKRLHPGNPPLQGDPSKIYPGMILDFPQPLVIEELDDNNALLGQSNLDLGPRVYLNVHPSAAGAHAYRNEAHVCTW